MTIASRLLIPALLVLASCGPSVVATKPAGPDPHLVRAAITRAASQVKPCYRLPKLSRDARQIVTRLRVRYAIDGTLAARPEVISQSNITPANQAYAVSMAQAAIGAVTTCAPLRLPPELHSQGWDEFELTFSLAAAA